MSISFNSGSSTTMIKHIRNLSVLYKGSFFVLFLQHMTSNRWIKIDTWRENISKTKPRFWQHKSTRTLFTDINAPTPNNPRTKFPLAGLRFPPTLRSSSVHQVRVGRIRAPLYIWLDKFDHNCGSDQSNMLFSLSPTCVSHLMFHEKKSFSGTIAFVSSIWALLILINHQYFVFLSWEVMISNQDCSHAWLSGFASRA